MESRALQISDTRVVIESPSSRAIKQAGKAPRRRRPIQWGALLTVLTLGGLQIFALSQVSHEGPLLEGIDPVALVPAALILLVGVAFFTSLSHVPSTFVFDDHGVRVYASVGAVRFRTNDHPWDRVLAVRLDDGVIVAVIDYSAQVIELLIGPALTAEERSWAFEAIGTIAADAGYGRLLEPHA